MSTLAERMAALKAKKNLPSMSVSVEVSAEVSIPNPDNIPGLESALPSIASLASDAIVPAIADANDIAAITPAAPITQNNPYAPIQNADVTRREISDAEQEIIDKTEAGFGYKISFDNSAAFGEDLRRMLFNNSMGKDFSVAEWELHKAAYNHEAAKVHTLSIIQIGYRIEALELLIASNNAMLQACKEVEKEKKKHETALEREQRHALQDENYKRDKKAKRLRKSGEVDKDGVLTGKLKKSARESFIEKMMKMGMAKDKAEKVWDSEE